MIQPRDYQLTALKTVFDAHAKGTTRQLVALPTGTGKTVVFSLIAKQLNARTLILAHTDELIQQAKDKIEIVWPESSVGIVQADLDEIEAQVIIASIQTARQSKRLRSLVDQGFDLCIVDEAHHVAAPSYRKVLDALGFLSGDPRKLLVGVTATPRRGDGQGLGSVFEKIVFERSIGEMIREGYLCALVGKQIVTRIDLRDVGFSNGDFNVAQLSKIINTPLRNKLVVENFLEFAAGRTKGIAFCADVRHALDLASCFRDHGIQAETVYGDMNKEQRQKILRGFRDGDFRVLTNCSILTEGFDDESIDCVILARPTASAALYTQMIGRGTRIHPLKSDCLVLDFCDNSARHSLRNFQNTLDGSISSLEAVKQRLNADGCVESPDNEIGDSSAVLKLKVFAERVADIEFFSRADFSWVPVGDSWHLSLSSTQDIWVRKVDRGYLVVANDNGVPVSLTSRPLPLNYALGTAEDWARRQSTPSSFGRKDAEWRSRPSTPNQIETLAKFGIQASTLTRGQAAALIDSKINEPATPKQIQLLCTNGVTFDPGITKMQAHKRIKEMKGSLNA